MDYTIFWTVLSAVTSFVIGQVIVKLVIEPVQEMKKTVGQVAHALIDRAHVISSPGTLRGEVVALPIDRIGRSARPARRSAIKLLQPWRLRA